MGKLAGHVSNNNKLFLSSASGILSITELPASGTISLSLEITGKLTCSVCGKEIEDDPFEIVLPNIWASVFLVFCSEECKIAFNLKPNG